MKIVEFLREDLVLPALSATSKAGALVELSSALAQANPGLSSARLAEILNEREKLGSTGVGEGIAIPHGKLPGTTGLLAAFGRSRAGIDFQSVDGKPAHLFFALFAPENSAGIHLKALARISRLFRAPQGAALKQQILDAKDRAEIYRIIAAEDARN